MDLTQSMEIFWVGISVELVPLRSSLVRKQSFQENFKNYCAIFSANFDAKLRFDLKKFLKNGKTYMHVENPRMTYDLTG